jgi:two-component system response regulator HydG
LADSVLLIDADADLLRALGEYFDGIGYEVAAAATSEAGFEAFERMRPDVVILDLHVSDVGGLNALEQLKTRGGSVILLTEPGETESAVRAMQLGAEHFLTKPVDLNHLAAATARVCEKVRLTHQNALLRARDHEDAGLESLGVSPAIRELGRQVELLAASERSAVLLTGESGTGKGWLARVIHHLSPHASGPFVQVHCTGLTATFLESELFGHEKGAFADAKERRQGLFELADRGTIFLDEIADLALELQPKLLNVLETKTFRRAGGTRDITVDVRLVAATNRDLMAEVRAGRFREDLYGRLSVTALGLPAVRERSRDDRLALLTRIVSELAPQMPGCPSATSAEALDRLLSAAWPGNVREMRNVVERAMILARGVGQIGLEHLPGDLRKGGGGGGSGVGAGDRRHQPLALAEVERAHIEKTLRFHDGNRTRAALELGISRATLINKIKVYGLDV